jgi:hypothetical protein
MSRAAIPFHCDDLSALVRALRTQLAASEGVPTHVELLNMLVRATGFRNFQAYRAHLQAELRLLAPQPQAEPVNYALVERLARFYRDGVLLQWPARPAMQAICLWQLWAQLPAGRALSEEELNCEIRARHAFGDHALLRRELCDRGLVARRPDGREYTRVERRPPAEAIVLIRRIEGGPHGI